VYVYVFLMLWNWKIPVFTAPSNGQSCNWLDSNGSTCFTKRWSHQTGHNWTLLQLCDIKGI